MDRLERIIKFAESQKDILITKGFQYSVQIPQIIEGSITIEIEPSVVLAFDVTVSPFYPFQFQGKESIIFQNPDLKRYGHIMKDGSICIHTSHSAILEKKLEYDFNSLRLWIKNYFLASENTGEHYEHIMVPPILFEGCYYSLCFNNVDRKFIKGEFGVIALSESQSGLHNKSPIRNFYIQSYSASYAQTDSDVEWNPYIKSMKKHSGVYLYIEDIPAEFGKFAFQKWGQLRPFLPPGFLKYLFEFEKKSKRGEIIPLMLGYKVPTGEIHWELIILKSGDLPMFGKKNLHKQWCSELDGDRDIVWGRTQNISYQYFFGRGKLSEKLTEGRILLIGVGAVGSIIANTLVRGGCKDLVIFDYDEKLPENICRSEYNLRPLVCTKLDDLRQNLYDISPYVTVRGLDNEMKLLFDSSPESLKTFEELINSFDFIFDCTTDNDLLYLFNHINIEKKLFSISISNKAMQLVCACEGDRYAFSRTQFEDVLKSDIEDMYNPTGCWSPTFKASYNDINILVQTAIKHINLKISSGLPFRNFVIETEFDGKLGITLNEF